MIAKRFLLPIALAAAFALPSAHADDVQESATPWRLPLDVAKVSSFFGVNRGRHHHGGIDFSIPQGSPVVATQEGTVVASTNRYNGDGKYGNVVVVEHPNGLRSLYAHLKERIVEVGEMVGRGQLLGLSGNTGHSTGPHLHLEAIQEDGKRIDPTPLLEDLSGGVLPMALAGKRKSAAKVAPAKHARTVTPPRRKKRA